MVAALRPMGEVAQLPKECLHTEVGLEQIAYAIIAPGEDTRVVIEATGRCHEPVAAALHEYGIYVTVLNPLFIQRSGGGSVRKVKTGKADAMKIAKYGLDNWADLREYPPMEAVRQQLKLRSRQYNLYMKMIVALQNNSPNTIPTLPYTALAGLLPHSSWRELAMCAVTRATAHWWHLPASIPP